MPISPRSPLAERVSFPSSDAPDVTLEGRLALRRGQRRISEEAEGAAAAAATAGRIGGGVNGGASTPTTTSPPLPDLALVLLHPHAALGGSMADPICTAIYREAKKHPRFGAVARYNARGAGAGSGGFGKGRLLLSSLWRSEQGAEDAAAVIRAVSTGEGIEMDGETTFGDGEEGEEDDTEEEEGRSERRCRCSSSSTATAARPTPKAAEVPPFSRRRHRSRRRRKGYPAISRTFVVGYSWGSCVGAAAASSLASAATASEEEREREGGEGEAEGGEASAARRAEIGGVVAVSPPLGAAASLALGSRKCFSSSLSAVPSLPVLVTMGDCDQFCGERAARTAVEGVDRARRERAAASSSAAFEPLRLEVSKGLDHFWGAEDDPWSREEIGRLAERVVAWILEQDAKRGGRTGG